jgi:hypothetical protein
MTTNGVKTQISNMSPDRQIETTFVILETQISYLLTNLLISWLDEP